MSLPIGLSSDERRIGAQRTWTRVLLPAPAGRAGRLARIANGSGDSLGRNAGFSLAAQLTTAAFTAGLTLFLVRALDPDGYGTFALAVSVAVLLVVPSDLGISYSLQRFAAQHRDDASALGRLLADSLRLKLLASGAICLALAVLAAPIAAAYGNDDLAWPLRGVALALFGQNVFMLSAALFTSVGRVSLHWRAQTIESQVETGAAIGLVLLGAGATGAAFGRAAGYVAGAVAGLLLARRLAAWPRALRERGGGRTREIARYAGPLLIVNGAFTVFQQMGVQVTAIALEPEDVANFEAPLRLLAFLGYGAYALSNAVVPRIAAQGAGEDSRSLFEAALRASILLQLLIVPFVVVWSVPLTELLLGPGYGDSADVLAALAPVVVLAGIAPMISLTVNYMGEAARRIPIVLAALVVALVLDALLIPSIGVVGGAIGAGAGYLVMTVGHLRVCNDLLGVRLGGSARALARGLLAAGAAAGVLALVGTDSLSVSQWVVGTAGAVAVFAGVLLATREVTRAELAALRRRAQ